MMHERYKEDVAPAVEAAWNEKLATGLGPKDKNNAPFRGTVARELFASLPAADRAKYELSAKKDKEKALMAYKAAVDGGFSSKSPEKRQECIARTAEFMIPIMEGLKDLTGYNWVLLGGGPTPRLDGEIGTVK